MKFQSALISVFLFVISGIVFAQDLSSNEKRGDIHFNNYRYIDALEEYQEALTDEPDNMNLNLKVAETYRILNDPVNAEKYYALASKKGSDIPSEYKIHYAQALSSNGKYSEAKKWYENYQIEVSDDKRSEKNLKSIEELPKFFKDSLLYSIESLKINSESSDFGPAFYKDGIVFSSSREIPGTKKRKFSADKSLFLDLYYSDEAPDGNLSNPVLFHKNVNSRFHEGPLVFYDGFNRMIFTRNSYYNGKERLSEEEVNHLMLFSSIKEPENEEWSEPSLLNINDTEHSTAHPTISEDGQTLYFSSDREGGFGGSDIYKSERLENGEWDDPENMGPIINSEGSELFPFVFTNQLYFASNGHGGLGGLDIFVISLDQEIINTPKALKNMGYPINSNRDDFGLIIRSNGMEGFFSSNRESSIGKDDIYRLKILHEVLQLAITDSEDNSGIAESKVVLSHDSTIVSTIFTDEMGFATEWVNPHRNYHIDIEKEGYENDTQDILTSQFLESDTVKLEVSMDRIKTTPENKIAQLDPEGSPNTSNKELSKEDLGFENLKLLVKNGVFLISENEQYVIDSYLLGDELIELRSSDKAIHFKYKDRYFPIVSGGIISPITKVQFHSNLDQITSEPKMEIIQSVYFGFDRYDISEIEAKKLDNIFRILNAFDGISLLLESHADNRGTDDYNLKLSKERAQATYDYLIQLGINEQRLKIDFKGEKQPALKCQEMNCEENIHSINRRTDFKIILNN